MPGGHRHTALGLQTPGFPDSVEAGLAPGGLLGGHVRNNHKYKVHGGTAPATPGWAPAPPDTLWFPRPPQQLALNTSGIHTGSRRQAGTWSATCSPGCPGASRRPHPSWGSQVALSLLPSGDGPAALQPQPARLLQGRRPRANRGPRASSRPPGPRLRGPHPPPAGGLWEPLSS